MIRALHAALALAAIGAPPPRTLPSDFPNVKAEASCPTSLTVWTFEGTLEAGDDWIARLLEIHGDRGRLAELRLRSETPRMPANEAQWFWPDGWPPETDSFTIATKTLNGRALDDLCADLKKAGIDAVARRSKAELVDAGPESVIVSTTAGAILRETTARVGARVDPPDPRPPERLPPIRWDDTYVAPTGSVQTPGITATTKSTVDRRDVTPRDTEPEEPVEAARAAQDDAERRALSASRDVVARAARGLPSGSGDHEDVPAARRLLTKLAELDVEGLPKGLPTEFGLVAAAASRDYLSALAITLIADDASTERLTALRILGDQPTPAAVEDLRVLVNRRSDSSQVQRENALALRALWRAAPDQARLLALRALNGPRRVARAAMGVFWFTEPALRRELSTVDFSSPDRIRGAVARIRGHIATTARDPELKRAAAGLQAP